MITKSNNNTYVKREFSSHQNLDCPICEGFSGIFMQGIETNESQFKIPSGLGYGCSKRIKLGDAIEVCFNDMQLYQEVQLSGKTQGDAYVLMFCLGENMVWQETNSKQSMELEKDTGVLYHVRDIDEIGIYEKGRHYQGITLTFHPKKFLKYFSPEEECSLFSKRLKNYEYAIHDLSSQTKIILAETLRCPYAGRMKMLYLEGKALELLAACVNTIREGENTSADFVKLSKMDMESIRHAKNILDNRMSSPITIAALARTVCISESKLKSGFKHVYGKPIYTYFLDKRMETARITLETQSVSIAQVAEFVGYESSSSFSKAFHKKFGFYPSECILSARFNNN